MEIIRYVTQSYMPQLISYISMKINKMRQYFWYVGHSVVFQIATRKIRILI